MYHHMCFYSSFKMKINKQKWRFHLIIFILIFDIKLNYALLSLATQQGYFITNGNCKNTLQGARSFKLWIFMY